jgi:hypothetical protein
MAKGVVKYGAVAVVSFSAALLARDLSVPLWVLIPVVCLGGAYILHSHWREVQVQEAEQKRRETYERRTVSHFLNLATMWAETQARVLSRWSKAESNTYIVGSRVHAPVLPLDPPPAWFLEVGEVRLGLQTMERFMEEAMAPPSISTFRVRETIGESAESHFAIFELTCQLAAARYGLEDPGRSKGEPTSDLKAQPVISVSS